MTPTLGSAITRAASKQTYYTIRFLVDRDRVDDAYRAYAYFRWVDDVLDADAPRASTADDLQRSERIRFLERQASLLEQCLRGSPPPDASHQEAMLIELVGHDDRPDERLETYLRQMMLVMDFDARRRGRLVSAAELDEYTRRLAVAVTEAMHYFIGSDAPAPSDPNRYHAVSGAHILHMLRDTYADVRAGYFNVPRDILEAHSITPEDIDSPGYREWVERRVRRARADLDAGRAYFARHPSRRHRLAGLAYIARFEWLAWTLERDGFKVRPDYAEGESLRTKLHKARQVASWMMDDADRKRTLTRVASARDGRV